MTHNRELLSALIDGETVDAELVAAVLESPADRALLVDFLRLRNSVQADDEPVSEWLPDRFTEPHPVHSSGPSTRLRAAAAIGLLAAGALAGAWGEHLFTRERPPTPSRVVQLQLVENR